MGVRIHLGAYDVWDFYQENKTRVRNELVLIAENTVTEYAVYLTEDDGAAYLVVCKGDSDPEYKEPVIDETDCVKSATEIYRKYLFPVIEQSEKYVADDEPCTYEDYGWELAERNSKADEQYERDDELRLAFADFLAVALQAGEDGTYVREQYGEEFVDETLDHTLEYLAQSHRVDIYRPMFVTDEDTGEEIYVEYPYGYDCEEVYD